MFNFEKGCILEDKDFDIDARKPLIDGLLYTNTVSLIYSKPKTGKTWIGYATAKAITDRVKMIYFIDMDNGISELKERSVDKHLMAHSKIRYMSRAKISCSPIEKLREIAKEAKPGAFKDIVFFLDTTKDFIDTDSKSQSEEFMKITMDMRDAGATVIIFHHATKTGKTISGVQVFINTPDVVLEAKKKAKVGNELSFIMEPTHARFLMKEKGIKVNTETLELNALDEIFATMSEYEEEFVRKAMDSLKKNKMGMHQTALLNNIGFEKTDKTARDTLDKFVDRFWNKHQESKGKPINYTLIQ